MNFKFGFLSEISNKNKLSGKSMMLIYKGLDVERNTNQSRNIRYFPISLPKTLNAFVLNDDSVTSNSTLKDTPKTRRRRKARS